ncbi:flavin reductase [Frigidibacter sp. MR17.24]|uniref:flavin reductase n=1 Tax=Frigidibacter sp. MR17.24 TaxID=3127345 RepID=UPI003012F604
MTLPQDPVARDLFREGMSRLAGAVNIITTETATGLVGFTASAVCSVSDAPPTLLVCVNNGSSVAAAFRAATALCVNTVGPRHAELARLFGGRTPMEDRFARAVWHRGATGAPMLDEALVSFDTRVTERAEVATHSVLFCQVVDVRMAIDDLRGSVWFGRRFHDLG